MRKDEIIRGRKTFHDIFTKGYRKYVDGLSVVTCINGLNKKRIGITFRKDFKGAVKRNRLKRIIREIFRQNKNLFPESKDVVFTVKKEAYDWDSGLFKERILSCVLEKL